MQLIVLLDPASNAQTEAQELGNTIKSSSVPYIGTDGSNPTQHKKHHNKARFNLLSRNRSIRTDDAVPSAHSRSRTLPPTTPIDTKQAERSASNATQDSAGLKTAPLDKQDRGFREMMDSKPRNRSVDRYAGGDSEDDGGPSFREKKDSIGLSSSFKDSSGAHFLSNMNKMGTKTAEGFGKAGKFLNKLTRSGSNTEREPINEMDYVCKVITLPLVEQTRITRISKKLADSKDKTEFWMPALPWRCIE